MEAQKARNIRIKTGSCKRILCDYNCYIQEVEDQKKRIEKMKEQNADPYDIKKQYEVLEESVHMIGDSKTRLQDAIDALEGCIAEFESSEDSIAQSKEIVDAKAILEKAKAIFL